MQPDAPEEQGSSSLHPSDTSTPSAKRRRQSPRSAKSASEQAESSNVPSSSGTETLLRASPQKRRGSSRESDMHRSASPTDTGSIKYTRTGRVSKATKGQRVHTCEECGKTYTRAEHLRRHQQNHKPGAFLCDVPGCGRSFYREDLLTRHKERHNDPLDPPTRRPSIGSQTSAPGVGGSSLAPARPTASVQQAVVVDPDADAVPDELHQNLPTTSGQQSTPAREPARKLGYIPLHELPGATQVSIPTATGPYSEYPFGGLFEPSPPYSPNGYDSPPNEYSYSSGPPYYNQPSLARARNGSSAGVYGGYAPPNASRSPISAGSSTAYLPQWGPSAQSPVTLPFPTSSSSDDAYGNGANIFSNVFGEHLIPLWSNGHVRMMPPEERDAMEMDELLIPSSSPPSSSVELAFDGTSFSNEQRYLGSFWMWIHPLFPVVHKPSFNLQLASPLLRAAMLALGAHMLGNHTDMGNARIVHERAAKVIKKRNVNGWHSYRVCDMQAIVLHEVYAIFRSRRPPLQLSKTFEDVYRSLVQDPEAINHETANMLHDSPMQTRGPMNEFGDSMFHNQDAMCKQRLLLACYILDQQHATLFGRPQTECMSTAGMNGLNLPFVRSQFYWDSMPEQYADIQFRRQSSGVPYYEHVYQAISAVPLMAETSEHPHDTFRSCLLMASLTDSNNDVQACGFSPTDDTADPSTILFVMEQSPRMRLAYHTFMLSRHTPIRDLLAVAGESWVMAEKLTSQNEFIGSQLAARDWAMGDTSVSFNLAGSADHYESPVQRAVFHALQILDIHSRHPKTGLLFQEWAIYLAAVVIWARAYISGVEPRMRPRLSIPSPTEPRVPTPELEQSFATIISAGHMARHGWHEAKTVLLWTKGKIERVDIPHNCGLTNGALDVVGKLVTRGNEEGWFA